jgi:hypothetical protein
MKRPKSAELSATYSQPQEQEFWCSGSFLLRTNPQVTSTFRDLLPLGQLDHVHPAATQRPSGHDRHFSVASTGRPDPEPIPEEIVSNRAPRVAALVPAQSDLMACSKTRQTDGVADSHENRHLLRLWASTRTRHARIAHTDRLDRHMPERAEK